MRRLSWLALALVAALLASACGDTAEEQRAPTDDGNNDPANNDAPDGFVEQDPGRVTLHRLNRAEYNNTVRDLLDTPRRPADDFPSDDHGYGFDNIADVLALSPLQLELYDRAAELLVAEALRAPLAEPEVFHFEAEDVGASVGGRWRDQGWNLWSNGELEVVVSIPQDGRYRFEARAFGQQAGPDPARMVFLIDGQPLQTFDVAATVDAPEVYALEAALETGSRTLTVAFINDFYEPEGAGDRNLIVDSFTLTGPLDATAGVNLARERILSCAPEEIGAEACARQIVGDFAYRAWRRPVEDQEVARLIELVALAVQEGDTFEIGVGLAMRAILISPHFLFRVEIDPEPTSMVAHRLTDHELATRLSYFLWSSTPDDELLAAAAAGDLHQPENLDAQVTRMLADPRAEALVENFAGQWLYINALNDLQPDYNIYPDYDDELREALRGEAQSFFREFLHGDLAVTQMFTAEFTWLNDRLARHYDMPPVGSDELVRVELADGQRGGLLTQGAIHTVTSYPTRTSPVLRGKWVLTQLLCAEPPPPPPGVEGLVEEAMPTGTLRERLEQHRTDPTCASCHNQMDPLGFGMESFDGIGAWRDTDTGGFPIDSTGVLDNGTAFEGVKELSAILAEDERFAECLAEKMYTYALGRGPERHDRDDLAFIREGFLQDEARMTALIHFITRSHAFQHRRGEPVAEGDMP